MADWQQWPILALWWNRNWFSVSLALYRVRTELECLRNFTGRSDLRECFPSRDSDLFCFSKGLTLENKYVLKFVLSFEGPKYRVASAKGMLSFKEIIFLLFKKSLPLLICIHLSPFYMRWDFISFLKVVLIIRS